MSRNWPYNPGDTIKSANDNADKEGLASGENDYDNNSMFVFRKEALASFFAAGTGIWSKISGRNGSMSIGRLYASSTGDRITLAGIGSKTFPATQYTYVWFHEVSGIVRYESVAVGAAPGTPDVNERLNAVVITNANDITSIVQKGVARGGYPIHNEAPISTQPIRLQTVRTGTTITPSWTNTTVFAISGVPNDFTIAAPSTTNVEDGQPLLIRIVGDASTRTISWGAGYKGIGVTLPTTIAAGKTIYVSIRRNNETGTWDVLSVGRE